MGGTTVRQVDLGYIRKLVENIKEKTSKQTSYMTPVFLFSSMVDCDLETRTDFLTRRERRGEWSVR